MKPTETIEQLALRVASECDLFGAKQPPDVAIKDFAKALRSELAKQQEPVAYLKFWGRQWYAGHGNVEADTGYEVCANVDIGDDGKLAFPVYEHPAITHPAAVPDAMPADRADWTTGQWASHFGGRHKDNNLMNYYEFGSLMAVDAMMQRFGLVQRQVGWNMCRDAMLSAAPVPPDQFSQPVKMVPPSQEAKDADEEREHIICYLHAIGHHEAARKLYAGMCRPLNQERIDSAIAMSASKEAK